MGRIWTCAAVVVIAAGSLLPRTPSARAQQPPVATCSQSQLDAKEAELKKVLEQRVANNDAFMAGEITKQPRDFVYADDAVNLAEQLKDAQRQGTRELKVTLMQLALIDDVDKSDPQGIATIKKRNGNPTTFVRRASLARSVERLLARSPETLRATDRAMYRDAIDRMREVDPVDQAVGVPEGAEALRDELDRKAKMLQDEIDTIQACLDKTPEKKPDTPARGGEAATLLRQVDVKEEPGPSSVGAWEFDEVGHRFTKWDALPGSAVQFTTPFSLELDPKGDSVKLTVRVVPNIDRPMLTGAIEARAAVNGKAGTNTVTVIASGSGKVESKILPVKISDLRVGDTVVIVLILTVGDTGKKPLRTSAKVTYTYAAK